MACNVFNLYICNELGLTVSGYAACPTCGPSLVAERPKHLSKVIYPNNHRFLPTSHSSYAQPSNGIIPFKWRMEDWSQYWEEHWATTPSPKDVPKGISRYSIFFTLPYWKSLKIQHLLDPMHIFKNVGENIWEHIIGKRDTLGAREDLRSMNRLPREAEPQIGNRGVIVLPKAPWILSKVEQDKVKGVISSIRTPTGYMRSLKGAFTKQKKGAKKEASQSYGQLYGLKSHDWHKMLQVRLPSLFYEVIYGCLYENVSLILMCVIL